MRFTVKVIPRSKINKVVEEAPGRLKVHLTAPPVEGKANAALIDCLAEHFNVKRRQVNLIRGGKSRQKVVEIG